MGKVQDFLSSIGFKQPLDISDAVKNTKDKVVQTGMDVGSAVLSNLDPANTETPIIGSIRKFNKGLATKMGDPLTYADPNAPIDQRLNDALARYQDTFMGAHGGLGKAPKVANAGLYDTAKLLPEEMAMEKYPKIAIPVDEIHTGGFITTKGKLVEATDHNQSLETLGFPNKGNYEGLKGYLGKGGIRTVVSRESGDVMVEMHKAPTPEQMQALRNLPEGRRYFTDFLSKGDKIEGVYAGTKQDFLNSIEKAYPQSRVAEPSVDDVSQPQWIRYADDANKETYQGRGGTWFTNEEGSYAVKDAMTKGRVREVAIGGSKKFNAEIKPKNPLVVDNANLDEGSFDVINSGYSNFISPDKARIANSLYDNVILDEKITPDYMDLEIMNHLYEAGIPEKQALDVLGKFGKNKFDAAMDLIIGKGLREQGYDALILKNGKNEHLFSLDPKHISNFK